MRSRPRILQRGPTQRALGVTVALLGFGLYSWLRPSLSQWLAPSITRAQPSTPTLQADVTPESSPRPVVWFEGACDASGAVEVDQQRVAVADDEDNVIRIYDARLGGAPIFQYDLSEHVGSLESDIEAATRVGDEAFFLASHGRTRKGRLDPNRLLFFGSELPGSPWNPELLGPPYRALLSDMLDDPKLARLRLEDAARRAPKSLGGLNIEGLAGAPDGTFWLGFRNPVPQGRALLIRLLNPRDTLQGAHAQFSEPVLLDLGGLGIRALASSNSEILIVAGPTADVGPSRLFRYDGKTHVEPLSDIDFADFNPEALFAPTSGEEVLVLSDDGERRYDGKRCKKLLDPRQKRFRGLWVRSTRS